MRALSAMALWVGALAGCAVPIRATISPKQLLLAIDEAEEARDGGSPAIAHGIAHHQRELRLAALRALARTAESGTSSSAIALLGDRDPEVATWAAFALGEIGEAAGEAALLASLQGISPVPDQALLALGRSGTATAAQKIAQHLVGEPKVRAAAALALGLMGKRLQKTFPLEAYAKKVAPLAKDPDREVRFGAVYALSRLPGPTAAVTLISILQDPDPEIRANAARGLGASKVAPHILDAVAEDPDWRVRVERVRALGAIGHASKEDLPQVVSRLEAQATREFARFKEGGTLGSGVALHSLLSIVNAAADLGPDGARVVQLLEKAPWKAENMGGDLLPDLARLSCAIAFALDDFEHVVRRVKSCGDPSTPAWRREELAAKLYARLGTDEAVNALSAMAAHQDARARVAAAEALDDLERPSAAKALVKLLDSNDPYVVSAAAEGIARPAHDKSRPPETLDKLRSALKSLVRREDAALSVSILDAIGALGKEAKPALVDLDLLLLDPRAPIRRRAAKAKEAILDMRVPFGRATSPLSYDRPRPIAERVRVQLSTERGTIVIELLGDVAPRTTGAIVYLAKSGFYADKTFHRIVSDFVAQGGCPRGDGWGGPGYTLEDETSPLPFTRGAVGIATSGRDTGGSQLFIMHAYHPHLDGNYTVVGRVIEGMETVDALAMDDRIISAEVTALRR